MLVLNDIKIYLYTSPIDMRKSIDSLCIMISDILEMKPTDGHLFLFRNRSGNKLKILYYQPNCFTLWYRRLEKGKFFFPKNVAGHVELSREHFNWLLDCSKYSPLERSYKKYENFY